jgi:hypothetical protein
LEQVFEREYQKSLALRANWQRQNSRFGTALTVDGTTPLCDEEWVLRSDCFGGYKSTYVADSYFHAGMFGPQVAFHEDADHLFWLLSVKSSWLPARIRETLLDGLIRCTARWPWTSVSDSRPNQSDWPTCGALQEGLRGARRKSRFKLSNRAHDDLLNRASLSREMLDLPESPSELVQRFVDIGVPERWLAADRDLQRIKSRRQKTRHKKPSGSVR